MPYTTEGLPITGNGQFGTSVSVSADGNTLAIGSPRSDSVYMYTFTPLKI